MDYESDRIKLELAYCLEKIKVYETLFHDIRFYKDVIADHNSLNRALEIICDWSYAHKDNNGERTNDEIRHSIEHQFHRMKSGIYRK